MRPDPDSGEVAGTKFFTWAIIAGAAFLLVAVTTNFTAKPAPHAVVAPVTTMAGADLPHRAS